MFVRDDKQAEAWELWKSGQAAKAIPLFRELIKKDPHDANLQSGLGWSLLNTGEAKEAHEAFIECLKLDAKHAAALNGAGQSALACATGPKQKSISRKPAMSFSRRSRKRDSMHKPYRRLGLAWRACT